nr:hypothetical protein [Cressdnaviricota sp.]
MDRFTPYSRPYPSSATASTNSSRANRGPSTTRATPSSLNQSASQPSNLETSSEAILNSAEVLVTKLEITARRTRDNVLALGSLVNGLEAKDLGRISLQLQRSYFNTAASLLLLAATQRPSSSFLEASPDYLRQLMTLFQSLNLPGETGRWMPSLYFNHPQTQGVFIGGSTELAEQERASSFDTSPLTAVPSLSRQDATIGFSTPGQDNPLSPSTFLGMSTQPQEDQSNTATTEPPTPSSSPLRMELSSQDFSALVQESSPSLTSSVSPTSSLINLNSLLTDGTSEGLETLFRVAPELEDTLFNFDYFDSFDIPSFP